MSWFSTFLKNTIDEEKRKEKQGKKETKHYFTF